MTPGGAASAQSSVVVAVTSRVIFHFTGADFQFYDQRAQFGPNLRIGRAFFEVAQTLSFDAKLAGGFHIKPRLLGRGRADCAAYGAERGLVTFGGQSAPSPRQIEQNGLVLGGRGMLGQFLALRSACEAIFGSVRR